MSCSTPVLCLLPCCFVPTRHNWLLSVMIHFVAFLLPDNLCAQQAASFSTVYLSCLPVELTNPCLIQLIYLFSMETQFCCEGVFRQVRSWIPPFFLVPFCLIFKQTSVASLVLVSSGLALQYFLHDCELLSHYLLSMSQYYSKDGMKSCEKL